MKQFLLKVWMTAALSLLVVGGVWGQTVTYSPTIGETGVSISPVLSIEFDGEVTIGSGSIYVYSSDYSTYIEIPALVKSPPPPPFSYSMNELLSIVGNTLFIDLSGELLPNNTNIYVTIDAGVLSVNGVAWDVLNTWDPFPVWTFTTESAPAALTVSSLTPSDDAPNVPISTSTFVLTFSENVELAGGTVLVELLQSGSVVGSTGLYSSNISDNVISLTFNHALGYAEEYEIVFPANAIKSVATGALYPGLAPGEWSFTTEAAPFTLDILLPEDGASNVALDASLVATFNQNIQFGASAAVHIYDYATETLFETVDVGLSVSGADLIINPTSDLTEGTHYYVVIPAGAVETTSGAPFAGLSDKDAWDFTTIYLPLENPLLTPVHNAVGVLKNPVLSLVFDKNIELGSGTIGIYNGSTQEKLFDASSSAVSIVNNNTLQIDLSNNSLAEYGTVYDVRIASTLIKRVGAEVYFGGFGQDEWSFTTEVQPDPVLMITSSLSPADGAVEVSRAPTLQVSFDQEITWGPSGVLTIHRSDNDATAATISREQTGASISQDQLSIVFSSESLEYGTEYYVIIDEGFVKALNTSAVFAGFSDKTVWSFTTETAPPFWEEGYPNISNQTVTDFDFNAWADNSGVYYGVVTMSSTAPSVEQIEEGLNQGGTAARIAFNEVVNDNTNPSFTSVSFNSNTELGNTYFLHAVYKSNSKYSDVVTITIDRVVPDILSSYPVADELVFPVEDALEISFTEAVVGANGNPLDRSHFSFELKDETIAVDFSISVVTESEMTKVVLTPTTALIEDTTYTITISEVYDLSGNPSDPVSITFETDGVSTWIGGNSSDWSDSENWEGVGFVQYKSVVIKSGSPTYPEITTGTIDVHNLIIQPGAVLTHTGGTLNVTGLFHLQSSDVVNATYLNNGGSLFALADSIRVDQVLSNPNLTYHISSPTNAATRLSIGSTQGVFFFNNLSGAWESNLNNSLDPGVGYITRSNNNLEFRGELNFTSFSRTVYRSTNGFGWNLIGNPYTAMLDFSQMITEDIEPTFWLWQNESGLYGTMNMETEVFINLETSYIPSNHSFFVKVKDGVESTSISFSPDYLTANTTTYLKAGQVSQVNQVKLAAVSGEVEDETAIAFISSASAGIDKYDSEKYLGGSANVLELFSLVGNNRLAINGMPLGETATIPLGYSTKTAGDYSIKVNTNTSESRLFLHDNVADVTEELLPGTAYSFNVASPGTNHSRFSLVVERVATGDFSEEVKSDVMKVMVKDRRLSVLVSPLLLDAEYYVVDMSGRILLKGKFNEEGLVNLGQLSVGSYVIQCNSRRSNLLERQKIVVY